MKLLTVKFGEKYGPELVNKFLDYGEVYCYTDNVYGLSRDITIIEPLGNKYKIPYFYKIDLFSPQMPNEQFLYVDLDANIYGDINKLKRKDFTLTYSYWRPKSEITKYTRTMITSGVMSWYKKPVEIYDYFINNQEEVFTFWPGVDPFVEKMLFNFNVFEEHLVGSQGSWNIKPIIELPKRAKRNDTS